MGVQCGEEVEVWHTEHAERVGRIVKVWTGPAPGGLDCLPRISAISRRRPSWKTTLTPMVKAGARPTVPIDFRNPTCDGQLSDAAGHIRPRKISLAVRNHDALVDELHLDYGRLAYHPAAKLHRVSIDRTRPRAVEHSTGDQIIARVRG